MEEKKQKQWIMCVAGTELQTKFYQTKTNIIWKQYSGDKELL